MSGGTTPPKPPSMVTPLRLFATFCVLAPTVAVIAVPTYNSADLKLGGFPFFYWYQLLWVVITGVLMVAAYWAIKIDGERRKAFRAAPADGSIMERSGDEAGGPSGGQADGRSDGGTSAGEGQAQA